MNENNSLLGGKDVLVKFVAQEVPVYSMSRFKLPRGQSPDQGRYARQADFQNRVDSQ